MKRKILTFGLVILLSAITLSANQMINLDSEKTDTIILDNNDFGFSVEYQISEIRSFDINTEKGEFSSINLEGYTHSKILGSPRIPILRKIISVPIDAEVNISITDFDSNEFLLSDYGINHPIMPAQPSLSKSANPEDIEFIYNPDAYTLNYYDEKIIVSVEELGIMRGVRLFILTFEPIKYNPYQGTIKVYNNVSVNVDFIGGDIEQTRYLRRKTYSPYFEKLYGKTLLNYDEQSSRDVITNYPIKYIIISDRMFEEQLEPFIEWKILKGYEVITGYTDVIGSSTTAIKAFIQDIYDSATPEDPAPSFVLFVGDVQQIPAWYGSTGGHITDLNYAKLDGNDFVPEMYYGRFSARNTAELQPQIDKTLEYEKLYIEETGEALDTSYMEEVVMIAGMDSSHGSTWGNGQINYGTTYYFNEDHGIFSHTYLYPASGGNAANIVQNVSDGVGYINYTAHGGPTSWSNPSFTLSDINSLQNIHEYCLAVGNCCSTNEFTTGECFGEAWLRAEDKGAIGYIGGTNSTYWDEDYWWGVGAGPILANPTYEQTGLGVYDGLFHDHDEPFADWFTTTGGMIYQGNLAVTEGGGNINYYWEIYSIMGDPSLTPFLGVPAENIATYPEIIFLGLGTADITADPYSYVSLSRDGEIYATALVDESGMVTLEFTPFETPGFADIVITCQNRAPIIESIQIIPNDGPYVIINGYTPLAGDDDYIEAGETVELTVSLENVGIVDAENVVMNIFIDDEFITLLDGTEDFGTIQSGTISTIENAFSFEVSELTPDLHPVQFSVVITSGDNIWEYFINLTAYESNVFGVDPTFIEKEMGIDEIDTELLTITNVSQRIITYTIRTEDTTGRDLTGSYIVCSTDNFTPGETVDWTFTVYNLSPDNEWVTDVYIEFPTGVTVNSATDFVGGSGGDMIYDETIGEAVEINWRGVTGMGYGVLHAGQVACATVNITTTTEFAGNIVLNYEIVGDEYGAEPHSVTGTIGINYPLSWISLDSSAGTLLSGESDEIMITFDTNELELGTYSCNIIINDVEERDYKIIPVTLLVTSTDSDDDFSPSYTQLYGNYPNPFNPETTISFAVDNNVNNVTLEIYNIKGQKVKTFQIDTSSHLPSYSVVWDGKNNSHQALSSGVYFYKMKAGKYTSVKKMILMK